MPQKVGFVLTFLWKIFRTAAAVAILFGRQASAACAPGATSFCQKLPDRTSKNSAIFLGVVRQVVQPTITVPPPPPQGHQPAGAVLEARRRAGDPLVETRHKYPSARFQVLESFLGAEPEEIEVRMTPDYFVDGIPQQVPAFAEGELWLVEAYRDQRDQQWTTSFCQRTKPASQAEEDLRVLRAWVKGQRLPARVTGEIWNPVERKNLAGVQVYLRGGKQTLSAITDGRGQFSFENLEFGLYEAVAALPEGGSPVKVDLTQAWCARVVLNVK
jgi:hypothetical protein